MREGLRGEASEMVKSILAGVLGNAEMWSRDVIEVRFFLFYTARPFGSNRVDLTLYDPRIDHHTFVPWSCMLIVSFPCLSGILLPCYDNLFLFSCRVFFAMFIAGAYVSNVLSFT
jgi:hypothetical protein